MSRNDWNDGGQKPPPKINPTDMMFAERDDLRRTVEQMRVTLCAIRLRATTALQASDLLDAEEIRSIANNALAPEDRP